ncbi:MAG: gliding motility-associated C-terminal domain-containing protein [Saprospiraceae bacterium]
MAGFTGLFLLFFSFQAVSQPCPSLYNSDVSSPSCFNGNTVCDLCVDDELTLTTDGDYLPDGGCVEWYYDTDPGFNPYNGDGTFIGCGDITSSFPNPCDQCPEIQAIFINSCGTEESNELFIFSSGSGFDTDDFSVTFPQPGIGPDADIPPCGIQVPTVTVSGCPNIVYVGPGETVPPGVPVIFFTSANANNVYDASQVCSGGTVYVMQNSCGRVTAAFRNSCIGCGDRTLEINLACGCNDVMTYDPELTSTGGDGDYVLAGGIYGNDGCALPAVNIPNPPPFFSMVDPVSFTITDLLCNGGPYYITGIISPTPDPGCGDVLTNVFEFDVLCPEADIQGDDEICEGETADLTATGGGTYLWSSGQMTDMISVMPLTSTTYTVTVTQGNCEDEFSFDVTVNPDETPLLGFAELCETDPLFDLSSLVDPLYPDGTWTGVGVTNNFFDPSGLDGDYTITFTPTDPCATSATTDITVNTLQTPNLMDATICKNEPPFDLSQLEDPNFVGDWSGPGVAANFFDPAGLNGTIFLDFTPLDNCVNPGTIEITLLDADEPDLLADTICAGQGNYNLDDLLDPLYPSGFWTGPNVNGSTFDPSGLNGVIEFVFEPFQNCVDTASTFILVTQGTVTSLREDTICQVSGPFNLSNLIVSNPQPGIWSGQNVSGNNFNPSGISGPVTITFTPTGGCATPVTTNLVVTAPISTTNLSRDCDPGNGTYIVTFEIVGSDPSILTVMGGGTLTGRTFVSDPIPAGTSYRFSINDGICNNVILNGPSPNCSCVTNAGSVDYSGPVPFRLCLGDTINLLSDSTFVLDNNDSLFYVIHTNPTDSLGDILAINGNPGFEFEPDTMDLDSIYYYSIVVGSLDGNGALDLADTCLSVASGVPFLFQSVPTVSMDPDTTVCLGESLAINFYMTGTPPFSLQVNLDGNPLAPITSPTDTFTLNINPASNRTYEITAFSDAICEGTIDVGTQNIFVNTPNSISIQDTLINSTNNTYQMVFEVGNVNAPGFEVTGSTGVPRGNIFTTESFPCNTPIEICVSSDYCPQVCSNVQVNCSSCLTNAGLMDSDTIHACIGDTITAMHNGYVSDGNDTLQFVLHDNPGALLGTIFDTQNSPSFSLQAGMMTNTVYYISAIAGNDLGGGIVDQNDTCFQVSQGTPIIWHSLPDARMDADTTICAGTVLDYDIYLSGVGPFDVTSSFRGTILPPATDVSGTALGLSGTFNIPTQIIIIEVADEYCVNTFTDTFNIFIFPEITTDSFSFDCDPGTQTYTVSFVLQGGDPGSYMVTGDPGTLVGNTFTSAPIASDSTYTFNIFDGNACDTLTESGVYSCNCLTDAGTIQDLDASGNPYGICGNETVEILHNNDEVLQPGEVLNYIIYKGDANNIDSILKLQQGNIFNYDPMFEFDSIYWITVVAGPDLGGGMVDTSAACLDAGNGVPVIFLQSPGVDFNILYQNCPEDCIGLTFNFIGQPGFDFYYSIFENGFETKDTLLNHGANHMINYCPEDTLFTFSVRLDSIISQGCKTDLNILGQVPIQRQVVGNFSAEICQGDSIQVEGVWFNDTYFSDTLLLSGRRRNGCDSLLFVNISILNPSLTTIDTLLCANDFITVNGVRYDQSNPSGQEMLAGAVCDSMVLIDLQFRTPDTTALANSLCSGEQITVNGTIYDENNPSGQEVFTNQFGCDSILLIDLSFSPVYSDTLRDTLCPGQILDIAGQTFSEMNPTGQIDFSSVNGCDSVLNVFLSYRTPANYSIAGNRNICLGDSVAIVLNTTASSPSEVTLSDGNGHDFTFVGINDGDSMWISPTDSSGFFISNIVNPANICTPEISGLFTIDISEIALDAQVSDYNGFNLTCFGGSDGFIFPNVMDGIPPFDYNWSDGSVQSGRNNLAAGNYYLTVSDAAGCSLTDSFLLVAPDSIDLMVAVEDPNCLDENSGLINLDLITGGTSPYEVFLDGSPVDISTGLPLAIANLNAGGYLLEITDANDCNFRLPVSISPAQQPQVSAGRDTLVKAGTPFALIGRTNINPASVLWEPPLYLECDTCLITNSTPGAEITYTITVFDAAGCSGSDDITIRIFSEKNVYVPSGFSPNGDGINDGFTLYSDQEAVRMKTFMVFDRWGNVVYEGNNVELNMPELGWDGTYKGKAMDPAVFVYFAEIEFADGSTEVFKGDVALVR